MALSEIEKLERRYAENPQGLTFAPLAEVHRKNGDVAPGARAAPARPDASPRLHPRQHRARPLPPGPGRPPGRRGAPSRHVLALDGENVIALKALADITERLSGSTRRSDGSGRCSRSTGATTRPGTSWDGWRPRAGRRRRPSSAAPDAAVATCSTDAPVAAGHATARWPRPTPPADEPAAGRRHRAMRCWAGCPSPTARAADEAVPLALEELELIRWRSGPGPRGSSSSSRSTLEEPVEPLAGHRGLAIPARRARLGEHRLELVAKSPRNSGWRRPRTSSCRAAAASEFQVANASEELLDEPEASGCTEPPAASEVPVTERSPLDADVPPIESRSSPHRSPRPERGRSAPASR